MFDEAGIIMLWLLVAAVFLAINGYLASNASDMAEKKGYEKRKWFHMCFWLGLPAYLIVIAMPDLKIRKQNEEMIQLQKEMVDRLGNGEPARSGEFDLPEL